MVSITDRCAGGTVRQLPYAWSRPRQRRPSPVRRIHSPKRTRVERRAWSVGRLPAADSAAEPLSINELQAPCRRPC